MTPESPIGRSRRTGGRLVPAVLFGAALIVLWEVAVTLTGADQRIFPPPSDVADALAARPGELLRNAAVTLAEMVSGYLAGATVGVGLGMVLASSRPARSAVYPWLIISQTIPIPAVAAVLVIWFGFSLLPKVIVVALIVFFPVAVSTADGLRAAAPEMIKLMRSLGAGKARIFREVRVPVALPHMFTGLKVAAAFSVVGAVFGEWVGARGGLGYLLLLENRAVNTASVFAIIVVLSLLGVGFFGLVVLAERVAIPWHRVGREE